MKRWIALFSVFIGLTGCASKPTANHKLGVQVRDLQKLTGLQARQIEALSQQIQILSEAQRPVEAKISKKSKSTHALYAEFQAKLRSRAEADLKVLSLELLTHDRESVETMQALFNTGLFLAQKKDFKEATRYFEKLYHLFPDGPKAPATLYQLGLAYKNQNQNSESREAFANIVTYYPGSREAAQAEKFLGAGDENQP